MVGCKEDLTDESETVEMIWKATIDGLKKQYSHLVPWHGEPNETNG